MVFLSSAPGLLTSRRGVASTMYIWRVSEFSGAGRCAAVGGAGHLGRMSSVHRGEHLVLAQNVALVLLGFGLKPE